MPIKPENKARYPADWETIRATILARAGNACELCFVRNGCSGYRGAGGQFCDPGSPLVGPGAKRVTIVLTIAHINQRPEDNRGANLLALCQRCHNRIDLPYRQENAAATRAAKKDDKQLDTAPIKARLAAATPGPWGPARVQKGGMIAGWPERFVLIGRDEVRLSGGRSRVDADAELIAHAPTDMAALIAEVERLTVVAGQLADARDNACAAGDVMRGALEQYADAQNWAEYDSERVLWNDGLTDGADVATAALAEAARFNHGGPLRADV